MNKDLDERIVPNGEYRNALNVQVSTSEGGDVGTVQNILGNSLIEGQDIITENSYCVGSVADEKNDKIYWFVLDDQQQMINDTLYDGTGWTSTNNLKATHEQGVGIGRRILLETGVDVDGDGTVDFPSGAYPQHGYTVDLVDGKTYSLDVQFESWDNNGGIDSKFFIYGVGDGDNGYRPFRDNVYTAPSPGDVPFRGTMSPGGNIAITQNAFNNTFTFRQEYNFGSPTMRLAFELSDGNTLTKTLDIRKASLLELANSYILEYNIKTKVVTPVFVDTLGTVLNFSKDRPITGINIIDDMLFWTDNYTEPKKINIPRSIQGTDVSAKFHTKLVVKNVLLRDILEKDITVIKKAPKHPLHIHKNFFRDPNQTHSGVVTISTSDSIPNSIINSSKGVQHNFSNLQVGDTFTTDIETDYSGSNDFALSWQEGDSVVLKAFLNGVAPPVPLAATSNWDVKGFITDWEHNNFLNTTHDIFTDNDGHAPDVGDNSGAFHAVTDYLDYEYYDDGATSNVVNQKLTFSAKSSTHGQAVKSGRHYVVSFDLDNNTTSDTGGGTDLRGELMIRLFNNATGPTKAAYVGGATGTFGSATNRVPLTSSHAGTYSFVIDDTDFLLTASSVFTTAIAGGQSYENKLVFESKSDGTHNFRGRISNVKLERIDNTKAKVEVQITAINGFPPTPITGNDQLNYAIDLFSEQDGLFETKFPRFSYRYKYEDGEYSTFAPFTTVVFEPGNFIYSPKEGHNLGMTNNIKNITIGGAGSKAIGREKPEDVVSIDILYREEGSPSVYVVDTLKNDENEYNITKETINGVLPENQLLRLWDNVPKKSLSQEVVGNRVVYGNYTQNYDLKNIQGSLIVNGIDLNVKSISNSGVEGVGKPSIKSLREYQLGVVYTDKYGRETPVLTNSDSTIRLEKESADEINNFFVQIRTNDHPMDMEYFKFYVKDTSGEYYNMAMDRYYDAEDGNVWLSFPSVDRSKVDIDDNIILKKGSGKGFVLERAKYKVIDIKNEAPEHIKKHETLLTKKLHLDSNILFDDSKLPQHGQTSFHVDELRYSNSVSQNIPSLYNSRPPGVEYYVVFSNDNNNIVSQRYKILNLEVANNIMMFNIEQKFDNDVMRFTDDPDNSGIDATEVFNNTYLSIIKEEVINSPKFDGRFFVKIRQDADFAKIEPVESIEEYTTSSSTSKKIYGSRSSVGTSENHFAGHGGYTKFYDMDSGVLCQSGTSIGDFILGFSATKTTLSNDTSAGQIGTLQNYCKALKQVLLKYGDYDYNDSEHNNGSHPNYTNKRINNLYSYMAFFRGINTESSKEYSLDARYGRNKTIDLEVDRTNNKFEDVWFIDRQKYVARFPLTIGYQVGDENPFLSTANISNGHATSGTAYEANNSGWVDSGSKSVLELTFGGIEPNSWETDTSPSRPYRDPSFFDLAESNLNYSATQGDFIKKIGAGGMFRFREDPTQTVYTIEDVETFFNVNYDCIEESSGHNPPSNENHHIGQVNSRNGDSPEVEIGGIKYLASSFLNASNFSVTYRMHLDKNSAWNPSGSEYSYVNNGSSITVQSSDANPVASKSGGTATLLMDSITGLNIATGNDEKVQVGMVLDRYSTSTALSKPAIITRIEESGGQFTLYFKVAKANEEDIGNGTSAGDFLDISTSDRLRFRQHNFNLLSANSAKHINYFLGAGESESLTGTSPVSYTIEFLNKGNSEAETNDMPIDPAVWETEPKETKDLDVYYEASSAIKIQNDASIISTIIPAGSLVEHIGSDGIPINTTVSSVSSDGIITMSNSVLVERTTETWEDITRL